jgi:hypothetical protein
MHNHEASTLVESSLCAGEQLPPRLVFPLCPIAFGLNRVKLKILEWFKIIDKVRIIIRG